MKREDINWMEKIDALELAAAVLLSYYQTNPKYLDYIISFLTQSQYLRQLKNRPIIKNRKMRIPSNGRGDEWITSASAEEIRGGGGVTLRLDPNESEFCWMLLAGTVNGLVETLEGMKENDDPLFNI